MIIFRTDGDSKFERFSKYDEMSWLRFKKTGDTSALESMYPNIPEHLQNDFLEAFKEYSSKLEQEYGGEYYKDTIRESRKETKQIHSYREGGG